MNQLAICLAAKRRRRGFSLRAAAKDAGVSFNTLHRVEHGNMTIGAPVMARLVLWSGADPEEVLREFAALEDAEK